MVIITRQRVRAKGDRRIQIVPNGVHLPPRTCAHQEEICTDPGATPDVLKEPRELPCALVNRGASKPIATNLTWRVLPQRSAPTEESSSTVCATNLAPWVRREPHRALARPARWITTATFTTKRVTSPPNAPAERTTTDSRAFSRALRVTTEPQLALASTVPASPNAVLSVCNSRMLVLPQNKNPVVCATPLALTTEREPPLARATTEIANGRPQPPAQRATPHGSTLTVAHNVSIPAVWSALHRS